MELNEYQEAAMSTAIYPNVGSNLVYPALKLNGEAGEVAEKIGKLIRDKGYVVGDNIHDINGKSDNEQIIREIGDVLWYVAAMSEELGVTLEYVAEVNLRKLSFRKQMGTLKGSGDER